MTQNTLHPNLISQLEVFRAVAETGSFSAAATRAGRAVSAVSYAIANLEQHLDVALFDRSGYRPVLTEEGRALLTDAEIVFRRLDRLNARVGAMKTGQEVELTLSVDTNFDRCLLARALARLDEEIPHLDYRLHTAIDKEAWGAVMRAECQVALVELNAGMPAKELDGREVAVYSLAIAAAPGHPLACRNEPIPLSALDDHRQIVVASHLTDRQDFDYRFHGPDTPAGRENRPPRRNLLRRHRSSLHQPLRRAVARQGPARPGGQAVSRHSGGRGRIVYPAKTGGYLSAHGRACSSS
jgi:DNA-binding transcriptional LysR family regulator